LRDFGLRRLLGVPVLDPAGRLSGVLHAGYLAPRAIAQRDVDRLQEAAAAIGRRLAERAPDDAHVAALTLQRSLLPAAPPSIEGLDVAVRYLPAEGDLGGDWYDIFELPGNRFAFALGDVQGHDLRSAIAMGRLRSALRAYALDYDDPAEVLRRLDRKLCYFERDITATVVYAVSEPPFDQMTISNAGHPAPLLSRPGQPVAGNLGIVSDLLMGVDPDHPRHSETIEIPPAAAIAFYTDGLTERRAPLHVAGSPPGSWTDPDVERLGLVRSAFQASDDAETACTRIIAEGLGDDSVEDDVALVVVRRLTS
jgi:serine phosphatase RsbU (regulator of sigma subunit)